MVQASSLERLLAEWPIIMEEPCCSKSFRHPVMFHYTLHAELMSKDVAVAPQCTIHIL